MGTFPQDHPMTLAKSWLLLPLLIVGISFAACSSTRQPRLDPTGELFPQVEGSSLDERAVQIPADLEGQPAILLIGYVQNSQFDLDRWILGLAQANCPVRIMEVPTLPGLFPSLFSSRIDNGMRSGIPEEDWPAVVTLYGAEAKQILALTGDEQPRNGRVLLLDSEGRVLWFHDRGYSASHVMELCKLAEELVR